MVYFTQAGVKPRLLGWKPSLLPLYDPDPGAGKSLM